MYNIGNFANKGLRDKSKINSAKAKLKSGCPSESLTAK